MEDPEVEVAIHPEEATVHLGAAWEDLEEGPAMHLAEVDTMMDEAIIITDIIEVVQWLLELAPEWQQAPQWEDLNKDHHLDTIRRDKGCHRKDMAHERTYVEFLRKGTERQVAYDSNLLEVKCEDRLLDRHLHYRKTLHSSDRLLR